MTTTTLPAAEGIHREMINAVTYAELRATTLDTYCNDSTRYVIGTDGFWFYVFTAEQAVDAVINHDGIDLIASLERNA